MHKILVTGSTGLVGGAIVRRLAGHGHHVRALVRDPVRAHKLLPDGIETVTGDITDSSSVAAAMHDVDTVYHSAGLPEQWRVNPEDFTEVNLNGTKHLVQAALSAEVDRFVYTSTVDVFAWEPGKSFDETTLDEQPKATAYERSKQDADRFVAEAIKQGLPARFLHPSAVYGAAPLITPGLNELLHKLLRNKVPMLPPGGLPLVSCDDVADGHIAAAGAPVGSRYILSESYRSMLEVAESVHNACETARVPGVLPGWAASALAESTEFFARFTKKPPLMPRGQLHFLTSHALPSAARAKRELSWEPTHFDQAIRDALDAVK